MKWDYEGDYLKQFPSNYAGTIGDRFCRAVRDGCDDPKSVLDWISGDLVENANPVWRSVAGTCNAHEPLAWEFAQHILERESLPPEEKYELKKASKASTVWHGDAPTEKQLGYLKSLGCDIVPKNKLEASELIEQYKTSRPVENSVDYRNLPF